MSHRNGIDLQVQGEIAGIDTQVVLTKTSNYEFTLTDQGGTVAGPTAGAALMMNRDLSATSLQLQVMVTPAIGLRLGHMKVDDARATQTMGPNTYVDQTGTTKSFGINYNYADSVRFSLEKSTQDPDTGTSNTQTLLTTIVAF